ncbi:MAG: RHS repeat-associated core domain-containing protein [Candidatus Omnitrophota bacterium]|nr:RHS repeat-associated core domain-containing protein [Candidatus Omnitrophota bacterium]
MKGGFISLAKIRIAFIFFAFVSCLFFPSLSFAANANVAGHWHFDADWNPPMWYQGTVTFVFSDGREIIQQVGGSTGTTPFCYMDVRQNSDGSINGSYSYGINSATLTGKVNGNAVIFKVTNIFDQNSESLKDKTTYIYNFSGSVSGRDLVGTLDISYSNQGEDRRFSNFVRSWTYTGSATTSASFKLPNSLDTIINSKPPATTTERSVTFAYSGINDYHGVVGYYYQFDANPKTYTTQATVTFPNLDVGEHSFSVAAKDTTGNVDLTPAVWKFTITSLPELDTVITAKPAATTTDRTVSFTYQGINGNGGVVGYYYQFDATPKAYTTLTTLTFSNLALGQHSFSVAAKDAKGNVDLSPAVWNFTVELPPPPKQTEKGQFGPSKDPAKDTGDPINVVTGNMYVYTGDISIPGKGINFDFSRAYNSRDDYFGPLGYGWTHSYNIFLFVDSANKLIRIRDDQGRETIFRDDSGGIFTPQRGEYSTLTKTTSGYTWRLKAGTNFYFDTTGKLLKVVDRNSNTITLTYNTLKQLQTIIDTVGRKVILAYDSQNRIISATNPLGKIYKYAYDANNNLISVTNPKGGVLSYAYDASHNLTKKTLPTANIVTFSYDASDRCTSSSRENNYEKVTLAFEPQSSRTSVKNSKNYQTTYYYNSDYQLIDVVDSHNNHTKSTWDNNLNLISRTDALGHTVIMEYDTKGNLIKLTDPLGAITTSTYELTFCNPTSTTDALGKLATYTYDTKGNLTKAINTLNAATSYKYLSAGLISTITNASGKKISFTYNKYANIASIKDLAGITIKFTYDVIGNKITSTDPRANITRYYYDELNRLIKINLPDKVSTNLFSYDGMDNLLTVTNAQGKTTTYTYDAAAKPLSLSDPLGGVITYTYDTEGNPISIKDQKNNLTQFSYDELNLLITKTDSANYKWNYFYDAVSNRVKETDPKGQVINYSYDELNRLETLNGPDVNIRFTYDDLSRAISMTDWQQGVTNYTYDATSELLSVDGPSSNDTVTYTYDSLGNRKTMLDPDNKLTKYAYDAANRITAITDPQNQVTKYTYDKYGNLATSTYPNKTGSIYKYDSLNRLGKLINQRTTTPYTKFSEFNYYYDALYRKTKTVSPDATYEYTYDALNQLTNEKRTSANTPYQIAYTYDAAGNRLTKNANGIATAYTYNNLNQLTKETTSLVYTNYYYDLNGNLIKSSPSVGNPQDLSYDCLNRLNKVTATGLPVVSEVEPNEIYKYDGGGNRVQVSSTGTITNFLYDGSNSIIERNASQVTNRSYLRNPNSFGGIGGIISQQSTVNSQQYYHYDSLGSVTTTSNPSSAKLNFYAYDSFGNIITSTGTTPNNRQFLTKEQDTTGLVYFGARYYDPRIGRFITPDPMGMVDGPNMYVYCNNDPINYIDPYGFQEIMTPYTSGILIPRTPTGLSQNISGTFIPLTPTDFYPISPRIPTPGENAQSPDNKKKSEGVTGEEGGGPKDDNPKSEKPQRDFRNDKPPSRSHYDEEIDRKEPVHWHYRDYNWNPKIEKWIPGKWQYGGAGEAPTS